MKFTEMTRHDDERGIRRWEATVDGYAVPMVAFSVVYDPSRGYWMTLVSPVESNIRRVLAKAGIAETDILQGTEADAQTLFDTAFAKL